jgi:hypothetical protein
MAEIASVLQTASRGGPTNSITAAGVVRLKSASQNDDLPTSSTAPPGEIGQKGINASINGNAEY